MMVEASGNQAEERGESTPDDGRWRRWTWSAAWALHDLDSPLRRSSPGTPVFALVAEDATAWQTLHFMRFVLPQASPWQDLLAERIEAFKRCQAVRIPGLGQNAPAGVTRAGAMRDERDSLLNAAPPDTPVFIIFPDFAEAPAVVAYWAMLASANGARSHKVHSALAVAAAMRDWMSLRDRDPALGRFDDLVDVLGRRCARAATGARRLGRSDEAADLQCLAESFPTYRDQLRLAADLLPRFETASTDAANEGDDE